MLFELANQRFDLKTFEGKDMSRERVIRAESIAWWENIFLTQKKPWGSIPIPVKEKKCFLKNG